MMDKDVIKQLKILQQIKPASEWKMKSRDILLSQISNTAASKAGWFATMAAVFARQARSFAGQPAAVVFTILAVVFGSGLASIQAAKDTKPGDSLYIAKRISEKTQFAFTFDDKEKAKLSLEFAGKRVKELGQVMDEPSDSPKKQEKIEQLADNFRAEIKNAKSRLEKISPAQAGEAEKTAREKEEEAGGGETLSEEPMQVFGANLGKDDQGIQISGGEPAKPDSQAAESAAGQEITATTTVVVIERPADEESGEEDPQKILDEAEQLFLEQDYEGTITKLEKANAIIKGDSGEVKGASEAATTSAEELPSAVETEGAEGDEEEEVLTEGEDEK